MVSLIYHSLLFILTYTNDYIICHCIFLLINDCILLSDGKSV